MHKHQLAILILGAGGSSRLGQAKQLLSFGVSTMLNRIVDVALQSKVGNIYLVLGASYDEVKASIKDTSVHVIHNKNWEKGLSTSIVAGVNEILQQAPSTQGILIMLGDQILILPTHINQVVQVFLAEKCDIVYADYKSDYGPPAIFGIKTFNELLSLEMDQGAKKIIKSGMYKIKSVNIPEGKYDIDTTSDYEQIKGLIKY
ncbi:MAG TPA: nucleotidyltransferase family protein [Saprospiraceae bacterium]|nr:nucleotidyltransferase family protein [Saprospiraceae bacterium]HRG42154.1 nucleotidyltransferase family protein [Saprospiraceae bacterium]